MTFSSILVGTFISGAVMMACAVCGLFFFKFYTKSKDRLILIFAVAFWMFAIERVTLVLIPPENEVRSLVFLIRMAGFLLIIYGIIDKNRVQRG